ncbi:MAG: hypothetical protein CMI53_05285 [Parcubacteria group bacterium]|jgi:hypothetical protein|nr:hypothetical protein [Parcubacteria group bacterium]|tara:strand:- start:2660 stop:2914 length:255 start_codon:yes stop_codon:yes gene_type:complete
MKVVVMRNALDELGKRMVMGIVEAIGGEILSAPDTMVALANDDCKDGPSIICSIMKDERQTFTAVEELAGKQEIEVVNLDFMKV